VQLHEAAQSLSRLQAQGRLAPTQVGVGQTAGIEGNAAAFSASEPGLAVWAACTIE
jgi:hypothetical protein